MEFLSDRRPLLFPRNVLKYVGESYFRYFAGSYRLHVYHCHVRHVLASFCRVHLVDDRCLHRQRRCVLQSRHCCLGPRSLQVHTEVLPVRRPPLIPRNLLCRSGNITTDTLPVLTMSLPRVALLACHIPASACHFHLVDVRSVHCLCCCVL